MKIVLTGVCGFAGSTIADDVWLTLDQCAHYLAQF